MSECRTEQIKCPRCHYDSPMTVWNSINADLDPELKEKFLSGELFDWKCEVCGLETRVPFGTLYHDMENKFMLFFDPWEDSENKHDLFEVPVPDGFGIKGYTFRSVYGMLNLREKIAILESGLNDIAVERMKFFIRLNRENHVRPGDKLFFYQVDTDPDRMESSGWERGAIIFVKIHDEDVPTPMAFKMELYYDYCLAVDKDPRMRVSAGCCACVDEEWMKLKLQEQ